MLKKIFLSLAFSLLLIFSTHHLAIAAPRTNTIFYSTNNNGVKVIPYIWANKKGIYLDFENFNGVAYVYYRLTYDNRDDGFGGGVEGSFTNDKRNYTGYINGKPYVRYGIPFGSCSGNYCVYHRAKNVKLLVNTKMINGKHYSKVITFPEDQF